MTLTVTKPVVNGSSNTWGTLINQALDDIVSHVNGLDFFPAGGIIMWSGTIAGIPSGWALCDGTNGTPNLVDRFIIGSTTDSGADHNIGDTGGANTINLSLAQIPSHTHGSGNLITSNTGAHTHTLAASDSGGNQWAPEKGFGGNYPVTTSSAGAHSHTISGSTAAAGSGAGIDIRPSFYALAFLMKL